MTFAQFHLQLWQESVGIINLSLIEPIQQIVIRGEDGDFELCAIHRDGNILILDQGQPTDLVEAQMLLRGLT